MIAVYLLLLALSQENTHSVRGQVVGEDGKPIAGVQVSYLGIYPGGDVQTNSDGRFTLPLVRPLSPLIVRFWLAGYRPKTKLLSDAGTELLITLQRTTEGPWSISKCASKSEFGTGPFMGFLLPENIRVRFGRDVDYATQYIEFKKRWMQFGTGPTWSLGLPPSPHLVGLTQVFERDMIFDDGVIGAEYRGIHSDGTYFRFIGKIGETVWYDHASQDVAKFFDSILDTLCKP